MFDEVFFVSQIAKIFARFFKKEQFTDSAVALNETKRDFLNCNKTL